MSDKSKLVYICSPYRRGSLFENAERARDYCRMAALEGFVPVAPHLLYPQFLDETKPDERRLGMKCGVSLLEMCAELWCFGDQVGSEGMMAEIAFAKEHDIPVKHFPLLPNDEFDECGDRIVTPPEYRKE